MSETICGCVMVCNRWLHHRGHHGGFKPAKEFWELIEALKESDALLALYSQTNTVGDDIRQSLEKNKEVLISLEMEQAWGQQYA